MKFKVTELGILGGGVYDSLEEAQANRYDKKGRTGTIVVEMGEEEYCSLLSEYETKINQIVSNYKDVQQKLESELQKNIDQNTRLVNELNLSKQTQDKLRNQLENVEKAFETEKQKVIYLEDEVKVLKKFVPANKQGPKIIERNPFASGSSFKIKPGLKKHIEYTERSLILLEHMKSCPAMTILAVERLLNCGRKAATAVLKKLWTGGHLDLVTCVGTYSRFDVYYLPTLKTPKTANQVCQMAILSLLYVSLAINNSCRSLNFYVHFSTLGYEYKNQHYNELNSYYVASTNFVYVFKKDGEVQKKQYKFLVIPIRDGDDIPVKDFKYSDGEMKLYIFPKNEEEIINLLHKDTAYLEDYNLLKDNIFIGFK